jgi:four helix bundle protein
MLSTLEADAGYDIPDSTPKAPDSKFQNFNHNAIRAPKFDSTSWSRCVAYRRFEELPVWNDAIDFSVQLFKFSATHRLNGFADLRSQIERAAISISNNIAESFERGTNAELVSFLYIARGSAGEVRSMLHLISRLCLTDDSDTTVADLRSRVESISRQLGGWIESIKDSGFQGTKSQNTKTREAAQTARRRDQFLARLRTIQNESAQNIEPLKDPGPTTE